MGDLHERNHLSSRPHRGDFIHPVVPRLTVRHCWRVFSGNSRERWDQSAYIEGRGMGGVAGGGLEAASMSLEEIARSPGEVIRGFVTEIREIATYAD